MRLRRYADAPPAGRHPYNRPIPKLSRNMRCPCGSGRKHCHQGNVDEHVSRELADYGWRRFMRTGAKL